MKPVLFLDVDDTLLAYPGGQAGAGVPEFLRWAKEHFEVRWLTMWCPSGDMRNPTDGASAELLALRLKISVAEVLEIVNPHPFPVGLRGWGYDDYRDKSESIRAMLKETPDRKWAWVEDPHLVSGERLFLEDPKNARNYYETSVSDRDEAVYVTAAQLAARFDLPDFDIYQTVAKSLYLGSFGEER